MSETLGRRVPTDWAHVTQYPLRMLAAPTVDVAERVLNVPSQYVDWYDQGTEGACFPPGTLIRMADGTSKRIEDVRTLDVVVTAEGNIGRVTQTMARAYDGETITIGLRGHRHLTLTPEHPVLVDLFGYTPASALQIGHAVALTRYAPPQTASDLVVGELSRRSPSKALKTGAVNAGGVMTQVSTPSATIAITPSFGRLIGLFLAEGSTTEAKVVWSFGGHERETLVDDTVRLIAETLGAEARVQQRPNGVCNVVLYGKHWRELFARLFQHGPYDKSLPAALWSGGSDVLAGVLAGWLAGDGHRRRTHTGGVTVSHRLALTMYDIAQSLGLRPTIRRSQPANRRERWDVEIADGLNPHSEQTARAVYRRVDSIARTAYQGFVFNIEVEGDHSYVAEGVGVHNCVGFAESWLMSILNRQRYDAGWLYREAQAIDEYQDTPPADGTSVRAGFDVLRDKGHRRMWGPIARPVFLGAGIAANRWATTVDEIRSAIQVDGTPVVLGINWYSAFDTPKQLQDHDTRSMPPREYWIGQGDFGRVRGGHAICAFAVSDRRQAIGLVNSWGERYPRVWMPFDSVQRLINEDGECGLVTDR